MSVDFHVIIPARYASSRLPGKLLIDLEGQTVLERVYQQACLANPTSVTIATDNRAIFDVATRMGAQVLMTSATHDTGTARITEAVKQLNYTSQDIVVNVQGDEPFIDPLLIRQVAKLLSDSIKNPNAQTLSMATLCWPIETIEQCLNPNVVKVVRDAQNNALYFSRSPIPAHRDNPGAIDQVFRHIGLYAYTVELLLAMNDWPVCPLASIECLEQLSVLWAGHKIKVEQACVLPLQDINTVEDLRQAQRYLQSIRS